jgi:hypothetical protein
MCSRGGAKLRRGGAIHVARSCRLAATVATRRMAWCWAVDRDRGLKSTATVAGSLRDAAKGAGGRLLWKAARLTGDGSPYPMREELQR